MIRALYRSPVGVLLDAVHEILIESARLALIKFVHVPKLEQRVTELEREVAAGRRWT